MLQKNGKEARICAFFIVLMWSEIENIFFLWRTWIDKKMEGVNIWDIEWDERDESEMNIL